jgi:serine/threonine-protein kinase
MTSQEKYRVVRKLDLGGMAEVFLGEAESIEGFKKQVAIKRVLPDLAANAKFLAMFLDEARISLGFNHANVVQTFDIGHSEATYFIVMEFVDGPNLKKIMETLRESERIMSVELAVYIVGEICRGLSYAHNLRDPYGAPLGIVHRDVSPPNILISKQGEVKIVDFGLAKATSQLEKTEPGVVKGKFSYLSPEAVSGHQVDHRTDIFACGIILYELLTGRRLFLGKTPFKTVELIRDANVPSINAINPHVPPNLDRIAQKALSLRPGDRYQGCDELAEALSEFLFQYGRKVTSFDVKHLVAEVSTVSPDSAAIDPSIIDKLIQEEIVRFSSLDSAEIALSEMDGGRRSSGAAPLDPSGFGYISRPPVTRSAPPAPGQNGRWPSPDYADANRAVGNMTGEQGGLVDQEQSPALAPILEGEIQYASIVPEPRARSRTILVAVAVAALAAAGTVLTAYALGWIP